LSSQKFDELSATAAFGKVALGLVATWFLIDLGVTELERSGEAFETGQVAALQAFVDARANGQGYADTVGEDNDPSDMPNLEPVPITSAPNALEADNTIAQFAASIGADASENSRWILGGAAVVGFATLRTAYVDGSRWARSRQGEQGADEPSPQTGRPQQSVNSRTKRLPSRIAGHRRRRG
jgi:hypothetical protein